MMNCKLFILFIALSFLIIGCKNNQEPLKLKKGDILFTSPEYNNSHDNLSSAINSVTNTQSQMNYTHMGILDIDICGRWVIHADFKKGVVRESLDYFLANIGKVDVYRIENNKKDILTKVLEKANNLIGQNYDYYYIINDTTQYCSGLIYRVFESADIFELEPMTFVDPGKNQFHKFWVEYYDSLGVEIPEGKLGCNPNKMAESEHLYYVGQLK